MNNVLGLRLAQIGQNGLRVLDRHAKKLDSKEQLIFNRICLGTITILSVCNLINSSNNVHFSRNHFDNSFPPFVIQFVLTVVSFVSAVKLLALEYLSAVIALSKINFKRICTYFAEDYIDLLNSLSNNDCQIDFIINLAAVLLSLKLVLAKCSRRRYSLLLLLLWNVNMLLPTIAGTTMNQLAGQLLSVSVNSSNLLKLSRKIK